MRRSVLACLSVLLAVPALPAWSQGQPPQAWLFGTWTGGLFPVPERLTSQACYSQPVVIFARDLVMRAVLTQQTLIQREVETARATAQGVEFRFAARAARPDMFGGPAAPVGFGCESINQLNVQRRGENEIAFPGCADFPYPLVRCR